MTKPMEKCPKRGRSAGNGLDAHCQEITTSSVKREKPRVEVRVEKKEGTTMTKEKRLDSLTILESLMSHPYGVVFNDIQMLRDCRPESFKKLEKPIDLETVKSTLENNLYSTVDAFAENVRTIFSKAKQIFSAPDDVHKMATKLIEHIDIGFKIKVESLNLEPKTCNDEKETQGKKTDLSSRKSTAARSGKEKSYVVPQEPDIGNRVSVPRTHLVKGKDEKSFEIYRETGISGSHVVSEELNASARIDSDRKEEAQLKVKEQSERERED